MHTARIQLTQYAVILHTDIDVLFLESPQRALEKAFAKQLIFQAACVHWRRTPSILLTIAAHSIAAHSYRCPRYRCPLLSSIASLPIACLPRHRSPHACSASETAKRGYKGINTHMMLLRPSLDVYALIAANAASGHFIPYTRTEQDVLESLLPVSVGRGIIGGIQAQSGERTGGGGRLGGGGGGRAASGGKAASKVAGKVGVRKGSRVPPGSLPGRALQQQQQQQQGGGGGESDQRGEDWSTPDVVMPLHLHYFFHGYEKQADTRSAPLPYASRRALPPYDSRSSPKGALGPKERCPMFCPASLRASAELPHFPRSVTATGVTSTQRVT